LPAAEAALLATEDALLSTLLPLPATDVSLRSTFFLLKATGEALPSPVFPLLSTNHSLRATTFLLWAMANRVELKI
jgi:hypothetical protein